MKLSRQIFEAIVDLGGLGLTRDEMPQINKEHTGEFISYLREKGIGVESRTISPNDLMPSQNELDTDKADGMFQDDAHKEPIFVSQDKYVLDGHHRWLAYKRNDAESNMRIHMIGMDAEECLEVMHDFDKSTKRDIEDNMVEMAIPPKQDHGSGQITWEAETEDFHFKRIQGNGYRYGGGRTGPKVVKEIRYEITDKKTGEKYERNTETFRIFLKKRNLSFNKLKWG